MTTTPALIDPKYTGQTWSSFQYKLKSETSTYATYDRWDGTNYFNNEIKVGIDSTHADFNIWSDADSNTHPYNVLNAGLPDASGTGGVIELVTSGGNVYFGFDKPVLGTTSGGGLTPMGVNTQTASFAGTTVQQIQWSITNGSSPPSGGNYYLFNESPGGTAKDTISIGSSPQAGATTTETYTNSSGADFTGVWYVGHGQNATRVNLATYNFNPRKVHCNFW